MPVTIQQLEKQREKVRQAGARQASLAGVGNDFMAKVKEELRQRAASRGLGKLAQLASTTRQEFTAAPAQMRATYTEVDPFVRMQQIAQRRAGLMGELSNITSAQEAQGQTIQDILGTGVSALQTEAAKAQTAAQLEQQMYENMANEYYKNAQLALERARISASASRQTGGLTPYQYIQTLSKIGSAQQEQRQTLDEKDYKLGLLDRAINLLEEGKVHTGFLSGRALSFAAKRGLDKNAEEFYRLSQKMTAEEMFRLGGKVLPAREMERLTPFLPADLTQGSSKILGDLKELRKGLEANYRTIAAKRPTSLLENYLFGQGMYTPPEKQGATPGFIPD